MAADWSFYRYYCQSQRPSESDTPRPSLALQLEVPAPPAPKSPFPFNDPALIAFAQLGALRLNTRRCLVSFFDRKNCYVLAEATRALPPDNEQAQFEKGSWCWGSSVVPRQKTLCFHTVNLSLADESTLFIVNDLSGDDRFKAHPAVVGSPHLRFYAGVPIRSPSGRNIGTYCVLDDKPHSGLSAADTFFLKEMATTVMRNLQMTRAADDHRRGEIMVRSLGAFAEGKISVDEKWDSPDLESERPMSPQDTSFQRHRRQTTSSPQPPRVPLADPFAISRADSTGTASTDITSRDPLSPATPAPASTLATPASEYLPDGRPLEGFTKTASSAKIETDKEKVAPEVHAAFTRAARMILESTEADGAVFLDAKVSTFGGMVDDEFMQEQSGEQAEQDKPCTVLGIDMKYETVRSFMGEGALRHLLRTYQHGQIFNFDDDMPPSPPTSHLSSTEVGSSTEFSSSAGIAKLSETPKSQDDDVLLREMFPKARSLVLYPLWDPHRDRWFAGAIIWSCDSMRVFTRDTELSYLAAFSNSIMAEVARLDTKLADAAKGDFISSISHELRSPLHGILGTLELLKETSIDHFQMSMLNTIETCGKTLLETINHVLDFAKINNLTRGTARRNKKHSRSAKQLICPSQSHANDIMTLTSDVDLAVLTEEVLESGFAGYNFQRSATQFLDTPATKTPVPPIAVIVDVNQSENYVFRTQPGAWRRILMNLFGNALKYTPAGFIRVKLQVTKITPEFTFGAPLPSKTLGDNSQGEAFEVRLIITDSGIGMSEEYVNNRLFHSFAQENPLSQGTGLGLSIVKQIVESLGGDVEVRSEKGRGTKFTVYCPLKPSTLVPVVSNHNQEAEIATVRKRTEGMVVSFVGFDENGDYFPVKSLKNKNATMLTLKAFENLCVDWFGMKVRRRASVKDRAPEIFVATEIGAKWLRAQHGSENNSNPTAPVVVICQGPASAQSTTAITVPGQVFECISQPCGPHKLAKALVSCLDRHANRLLAHAAEANSTSPMKENEVPSSPVRLGRELELLKTSSSTPTRGRSRPPITSSLSAPQIRSASSSPVKKATRPTRSLHCLAVDDNHINLRLLKSFLDKLGHTHTLAVNGLEAVTAYKEASASNTHFDAVLMDIHMPVMDGFEASRQIRAFERENGLQDVHIIALTGAASAEAQDESKGSGINFHLIKPVGLAHLKMVLDDILIGQGSPKDTGKELEEIKEEKKDGHLDERTDGSNDHQKSTMEDNTAATQAGHDDSHVSTEPHSNQKDENEDPNRNDSATI
ncbi:hypothetical protein K491DRAFT_590246 [Lophiostoma macrostomum CBS 122681]|uniref:Sensor histidine kinase-like protein/response regulator n=1 Tax=Lophiostoma macrostomum CBS 122681 TaxID=1314788 RepID=A0A6A6TMW1_9PLEO|nr:hypothetical protein K491DRAFT_590246 [Lophiostoma macrostomum CBS 122681]